MKAECPLGHSENLSYQELADRLREEDFGCKAHGCTKSVSLEVDERFWKGFVHDARISDG